MSDIIIIGGGAAGLMAALAAERTARELGRACSITLLERQARLGRKLAASGNGRCNLSNMAAEAPDFIRHYHGQEPDFCRPALLEFGPTATRQFLAELGLVSVSESDGRVYPFSDTANSVCDVLRLAAEAVGVRLLCGATVTALRRDGNGFSLQVSVQQPRQSDQPGQQEQSRPEQQQSYGCQRLIVACGGMAGARLGGCDDGYRLLQSLGHQRGPLYPALTQLKTDNRLVRPLKGVRAAAALTLLDEQGRALAHSSGEIQFSDFGVSGPAAFELSRELACRPGRQLQLSLDLLPPLDQGQLEEHLQQRQLAFPQLTVKNLLTGSLHNRLGLVLCQRAGLQAEQQLWQLSEQQLRRLARTVKAWTLPLGGVLGFEAAQVTAGGMLTCDFAAQTMQSRLVSGLYACGELLDIDGDCGGYNLQWAWSSGYLAGKSAALSC